MSDTYGDLARLLTLRERLDEVIVETNRRLGVAKQAMSEAAAENDKETEQMWFGTVLAYQTTLDELLLTYNGGSEA